MSNYELLTLYSEQVTMFFTAITIMMTVLFSYLVGAFFIGRQLPALLFWVLNGLALCFLFLLSGAITASGNRAVGIGQELVRRIHADGSDIAWMSTNFMPAIAPPAVQIFILAASVLAVVYAMVHRRHR